MMIHYMGRFEPLNATIRQYNTRLAQRRVHGSLTTLDYNLWPRQAPQRTGQEIGEAKPRHWTSAKHIAHR